MLRRITLTASFALLALVIPVTTSAQVAQPAAPNLQDLIRELQQVDNQLQPFRQQALQDATLKAEQEQLQAAVQKALVAANPNIQAQLDRADKIKAEITAAQAANEAEKVAALNKEAETIQQEISKAQAAVLDQPEISAQVTAFSEKLNKKMIEINADAKALIDRRSELELQIKKARAGA